jgi:hypothetical protein
MKVVQKNRKQVEPARLLAELETAGIQEPINWRSGRREATIETMPPEGHRR